MRSFTILVISVAGFLLATDNCEGVSSGVGKGLNFLDNVFSIYSIIDSALNSLSIRHPASGGKCMHIKGAYPFSGGRVMLNTCKYPLGFVFNIIIFYSTIPKFF